MKRLAGSIVAMAALSGLAGCNESRPAIYDDPTSLLTETTQNGITLEIVSPVSSYSTSPQVDIDLRVTRIGAAGGSPLVVMVGVEGGLLLAADAIDSTSGLFRRRVSLEHGRNTLIVEVRDLDGRLLRDARFTLRYDGTMPGLAVVALGRPGDNGCVDFEPIAEPIVNTSTVCVIGRASEAGGLTVRSVAVEYVGGSIDATLDADSRFSVAVPLVSDSLNSLRVVATSDNAERTQVAIDVRQDATAPTMVLAAPATTQPRTDEASITLEGTAEDEFGIDAIRLETGNAGVTYLPVTQTFSVDVRLENGSNAMSVVAIDRAGNEARLDLDVFRDRIIHLRFADDSTRTATLRLDRTALEALITPDERAQIRLVDIPLRGTIASALTRLSDPETYGIDTSTWGEAEFNLQRLMVTTPDSADLSGSSLEALLTLSQGIGLPAPRLIAQLVDIGVSDPLLTTDVLTDVFLEYLVGTHPAVTRNEAGEPVITVSLQDALTGLSDLGTRFGPSGEHPGFVTGATSSTLFEPGFAMSVDATTNLLERQGVDASDSEKDYLYLRSGDQILTFDFLDRAAFSVVGLVNEPTVDLRIDIKESPDFFVIGDERTARPDGDTGAWRGNGTVWDESPWVLERLIAEGVYEASRDRFESTGYRHEVRYSAGAVENAATMLWERGWVTLETSGGLGDPPPPFYSWDLLTEVAQLRLHDGGIEEGAANVQFVLRDLPVGITADELIEALRPTLQSQEALLSNLLLGETGIAESECDFYLDRATDDGDPWLFFREPSDSPGGAVYARPGFFADLALTERLSERVVAGGTSDTEHEKIRAREGQEAYFADDTGRIYRLRVVRADRDGADLLVVAVEGS